MVVRKDLPVNNLKELASWLKTNKASASTTGTASLARFCGMLFQEATGTNYQFVPYRGGAQSLPDLVGGHIDLKCDLAANSLVQRRAGNIKALAVMTKTRWFAAPDLRPLTRPACRESISAHGTAFGRRGIRRLTSSPGSIRPPMRRWPSGGAAGDRRNRPGRSPACANAVSVRAVPQGRDRQVVPDREGRRDHGRVGGRLGRS